MTNSNSPRRPSPRNHVVIVGRDHRDGSPIYLGDLNVRGVRGERSGCRRLENAIRFTERGARRVAAGYAEGEVALA